MENENTTTLRVPFIKKKMMVNKHTLEMFHVYDDERRQLRAGQVASIKEQFGTKNKAMRHFGADFIVNQNDDEKKLRLIDGNHRLEAIKQKIALNPAFEIEIWVDVYRNLTREQEREVYSQRQKAIKQTATDFLANYKSTIPMIDKMLKELPVGIYPSEKRMPIKLFAGAHILAKTQKKFNGTYGAGGQKTVDDLKEITEQDIKTMKAFYKDMIEVFGEYYKANNWYRPSCLTALYRIWYDNLENIPRDQMIQCFSEVMAKKSMMWESSICMSTREVSIMLYNNFLNALSNYRKRLTWQRYRDPAQKDDKVEVQEDIEDDEE